METWLFPTICFVLFCYTMVFVGVFTYYINPNVSLFRQAPKSGTTTIEDFQRELNKAIK